ncbi:MAG: glycoside hydrolase family 78 protein [Clostridiales bacterium]|nr:glycoside hydrolase family 78 protein [Clostridiales bacterium]
MRIANMRAEGQAGCPVLDEASPVLSWNIETAGTNWKQAAYRVRVSQRGAGERLVWDSGRVESDLLMAKYGGAPFESDTAYAWTATVWSAGGDAAQSDAGGFRTGLLAPADWKGAWIGETGDGESHVYRLGFSLERAVASARLFVCGLGHYEMYLNGAKVGDRVLEPGWSDYRKTAYYSAYDVTGMLQPGANAAGALLGDGMYNVVGGRYAYYPRSYGKMKLLAQLNVTYENGERACIATGPDWRMAESPYRFCCMYGGEDYDARLELPGFSCAGFREGSNWSPAVQVGAPECELKVQAIAPCKAMRSYGARRTSRAGALVYDFGVNFSGWPRISLSGGRPGDTVKLFPAEVLGGDGLPDQFVTKNGFCWQVTLAGARQTAYEPKFSYYGFRYLLVEGAREAGEGGAGEGESEAGPFVESLAGQFVYPDVEAGGGFACSNALFSQIHAIVRQAMLSNLKSYLTDCPHREKLPWMEQAHLIGPSLMYNFELGSLFQKIMRDIADAQHEDGMVPDICPQYVEFGYHRGYNDSPEWGSAAILIPWQLHRRYGDDGILARNYGAMRRYAGYLESQAHHHVLHHGLGDWLDVGPCPPFSQNTPVPVTATCIYHLCLLAMAGAAAILGKAGDEERYRALAGDVRREFRAQFLDRQSHRVIRVANCSQAAQAMALMCGMVDEQEEELALRGLLDDIEKRGYATTAGDVGHPFVIAALIRYGCADAAARMVSQSQTPGYGYQVRHGATALCEAWDGPDPERPHGSQNHLMLGSVEEWFYAGLAGFANSHADAPFCAGAPLGAPVRAGNPLNRMVLKPQFAEGCDEVDAWVLHPYGRVSLRWKREGGVARVRVRIPPGMDALFVSQADGSQTVLGSGEHELAVSLGKGEPEST